MFLSRNVEYERIIKCIWLIEKKLCKNFKIKKELNIARNTTHNKIKKRIFSYNKSVRKHEKFFQKIDTQCIVRTDRITRLKYIKIKNSK